MVTNWISWRSVTMGLLGVVFTGCAQTLPSRQLALERHIGKTGSMEAFTEASEPHEPAAPGTSTLDDLLELAKRNNPELRAAQARVEVARGKMIQAGLYPNPAFGPNFAQLGDVTNRLGEPGVRIIQTFVTAHKLQIARAAGAHAVEAADFQAITKWHEIVARVRISYYELLTALREQDTLTRIVSVAEETHEAIKRFESAGDPRGNPPDVLRATVELEQNKLRKQIAARRVEAARQSLWTVLGRPAGALDHFVPDSKELELVPPVFEWNEMLDWVFAHSSELNEARALVAQQEQLLAKAKADACPNVTVTAIPFYESPQRAMHAEIIVTMPLPLFDRNQGNIHAAQWDLIRSNADENQVELRLTERLTIAYQRYQVARQQTDTYQKVIVPKADESLKLVQVGYRGGDKKYDYTTVLQAQQVLFQSRLAETQSLGELWRSVVEIANILQQERLPTGAAPWERR